MSKLIAVVVPKAGISVQRFHDMWRHAHGTISIGYRPLRRYIQNHRIDSDLIGPRTTAYEGVVEATFDSIEAIANLGTDPVVINHFYPDEARFEDRVNTLQFIVEEEVLRVTRDTSIGPYADDWSDNNRPISIKLFQFIRADGEQPWVGDDDVGLSNRIRAYRHVRSYTLGGGAERDAGVVHYEAAARASEELQRHFPMDPFNRPYIGIRELWWPTLTAFEDGISADPEAWATLRDRPSEADLFLSQAERLV